MTAMAHTGETAGAPYMLSPRLFLQNQAGADTGAAPTPLRFLICSVFFNPFDPDAGLDADHDPARPNLIALLLDEEGRLMIEGSRNGVRRGPDPRDHFPQIAPTSTSAATADANPLEAIASAFVDCLGVAGLGEIGVSINRRAFNLPARLVAIFRPSEVAAPYLQAPSFASVALDRSMANLSAHRRATMARAGWRFLRRWPEQAARGVSPRLSLPPA